MPIRVKRFAKSQLFRVRRDDHTGHLYYIVEGKRLYIRSPEECERPRHRRYALNEIYFKHYRPTGGDVVVDVGAGLGTEILGLTTSSPNVRYIAVEIQPWVYECLCLTLSQLPDGYTPFALAIGAADHVHIAPTRAGIDASIAGGGPVRVEGIRWGDFMKRHGIDCVDLLKMNVEGAEADLLGHIDLDQVRRVIVSAHDFKADRGQGEHYRTRAIVEKRLERAGFTLIRMSGEQDWMRSWIYADRS